MAETTTIPAVTERGHRKERVGEVISNKMAKTIVVRVERRFPHPRYKKVVTGYSKFYARTTRSNEAKVGDRGSSSGKPGPCPRPRTGGWWRSWSAVPG